MFHSVIGMVENTQTLEGNHGDLIGMAGDIAIAVLFGLLMAGMSATGDAPEPAVQERAAETRYSEFRADGHQPYAGEIDLR